MEVGRTELECLLVDEVISSSEFVPYSRVPPALLGRMSVTSVALISAAAMTPGFSAKAPLPENGNDYALEAHQILSAGIGNERVVTKGLAILPDDRCPETGFGSSKRTSGGAARSTSTVRAFIGSDPWRALHRTFWGVDHSDSTKGRKISAR